MIRLSIEPAKRDGAGTSWRRLLERFRREDPTFRVFTDEETGQTIIAGMGQLHLEIYTERIKREYKVECLVGEPALPIGDIRRRPWNSTTSTRSKRAVPVGTRSYRRAVDPIPLETMTDTYV